MISKAGVESLLNLEQAMTLTPEAFREQSAGGVVGLPPRHIPVPRGALLRIVSGALVQSQRMGIRVGSAEQLAGEGHAAVLFDSDVDGTDLLEKAGYVKSQEEIHVLAKAVELVEKSIDVMAATARGPRRLGKRSMDVIQIQ